MDSDDLIKANPLAHYDKQDTTARVRNSVTNHKNSLSFKAHQYDPYTKASYIYIYRQMF